ncbi:unnamed protein product [Arctia plantaginis]|uniref:Uncharacterized protein n=1 Tax=Arctia plantaginis TaxID=874455 RepID=A0A8S0YRZ3_ARCPL|nr:unnamed protein product [Arctia plantaginis]
MPQKKNNNNESSACADSCSKPAISQPKAGHYICLSHQPSDCSMECTSCHSGICNSQSCKAVKILDDYEEPAKVSEVNVSKGQLGKCDKCGAEPPNVHAGNQTSRSSTGFNGPCSTCSRSTTFSSDKLKSTESPSQRSFRIPPTTPVKPHSCGITRPPEEQSPPQPSSRTPPTTPGLPHSCGITCPPEEPPRNERKSSTRSLPECCQEKKYPKEQVEGNVSSQNIKRQSDGSGRLSTSIPPPPPEPARCTMAGCPVACIPEEKNHSDVPAHETSKVYTMPLHPPSLTRRQGSNIAANANQISNIEFIKEE